jgi:hypothetical protein
MASANPPNVESKASKRQSLLLPRGTVAAAVQRGAAAGRPRPMSVFGLDSQSMRELQSLGNGAPGRPNLRPPTAAGRPAEDAGGGDFGLARPSQSGIARSQSLRRPMTGNGVKSHIRYPSTSDAGSSLPKLAEDAAAAPPPAPAPRSRMTRTPSDSSATESGIARPRLPTGGAAGGLHRSNTLTNRPGRAPSALPAPSAPLALPGGGGGGARPASVMLPHKPNFSTLQQHYSPRKAVGPRPASTTLINPPAGPGPDAPSAPSPSSAALETQFLQIQLMQLSLLHAAAHPSYAAWCKSARQTLRGKFHDVAALAESVQRLEREARARRNVAALQAWGGGVDADLGAHVQALAGVVGDLLMLCEDGGRASLNVDVFADWIEAVDELWGMRRDGLVGGDEFIDGLGENWRGEVAALLRRVTGLLRVLEALERPVPGSTVDDIVRNLEEFLKGTLEELQTIQAIEKVVMDGERQRIDNFLRHL